jgi:hypothetical protein
LEEEAGCLRATLSTAAGASEKQLRFVRARTAALPTMQTADPGSDFEALTAAAFNHDSRTARQFLSPGLVQKWAAEGSRTEESAAETLVDAFAMARFGHVRRISGDTAEVEAYAFDQWGYQIMVVRLKLAEGGERWLLDEIVSGREATTEESRALLVGRFRFPVADRGVAPE